MVILLTPCLELNSFSNPPSAISIPGNFITKSSEGVSGNYDPGNKFRHFMPLVVPCVQAVGGHPDHMHSVAET